MHVCIHMCLCMGVCAWIMVCEIFSHPDIGAIQLVLIV